MKIFIILSVLMFIAASTALVYMIVKPIWVRSKSYQNKRIKHEDDELKGIVSEYVMLDDDKETWLVRALKKIESGYFSYDRIHKFLLENGNHSNYTPSKFILFKFLFAFVALILTTILEVPFVFCLIASVVGFFFPDISEIRKNKQDEKTMVFDLENIYNCLHIQTKAGNTNLVLIIESIHEVTEQKRLKKALEELAVDIFLASDYRAPFEAFKAKFKSTQINILMNAILQYQTTGITTTSFKDMATLCSDKSHILVRARIDAIKGNAALIQLAYVGALMFYIVSFVFEQLNSTMAGIM